MMCDIEGSHLSRHTKGSNLGLIFTRHTKTFIVQLKKNTIKPIKRLNKQLWLESQI